MLKLYIINSGEIDWVAANDETEARRVLIDEYGLGDDELDDVPVKLVKDASAVTVYLDEVDAETEEEKTATAEEVMAKMTKPGLVASTANL